MEERIDRPNCYLCKWRRNILGDSHSCCVHPSYGNITRNPLGRFLGAIASSRQIKIPSLNKLYTTIKVRGDLQAAEKGWFNHPFNFDPRWLLECTGFEGVHNEQNMQS